MYNTIIGGEHMPLTKEDLQAIRELMREETAPINARLDAAQADLAALKEDVSELKEDVSGLKEDVSGLKEDVSELKEEAIITRNAVNTLLNWAERADRTVVNAGLYEESGE